jgi:hypothetical protein
MIGKWLPSLSLYWLIREEKFASRGESRHGVPALRGLLSNVKTDAHGGQSDMERARMAPVLARPEEARVLWLATLVREIHECYGKLASNGKSLAEHRAISIDKEVPTPSSLSRLPGQPG